MDAMYPLVRVVTRIAVIAGVLTLALSAAPASAAPVCAERVIADWSDNGRIDRVYSLECYEAAIDTIPVDLRDYTNAADVIARALSAASREQPPTGGVGVTAAPAVPETSSTSSESSFPLPLLVILVVSGLVLGGGIVSQITRRQRTSHHDEPAAD